MRGLDNLYRKFIPLNLFTKGWGNPALIAKIIENHKEISKRETCKHLVKSFDIKISKQVIRKTSTIIEGSFLSPFYHLLPESMDDRNKVARFQLIIPNKWPTKYKPLCILYARTGDHQYNKRRRFCAERLLKDGIASLIHINPYYGSRKPRDQWRSSLNYVSDLFVMGGALILEGHVLLDWATRQGFGPLAIHGVSMGGYMASLVASTYTEPVCLIPCLSGTTASHVYTEGAISKAVQWNVLSKQYSNDSIFSEAIRAQIEPPVPYHLQKCINHTLSTEFVMPPVEYNPEPQHPNPRDNETRNIQTLTSIFDFVHWSRPMELINYSKYAANFRSIKESFDQHVKVPFIPEHKVDRETVEFMRDIVDFFTHLGNYSRPVDPRLVTVVIADCDKYIPVDGVANFSDIWNTDIEIEVLKGWDHVGCTVGNMLGLHDKFGEAIVRTLNRYVELYHNEQGPFGVTK